MRFASLGSGSRGNALVVESGATRILVDCGFSTRVTLTRLARLGLAPEDIDAVLVTHEHSDHLHGVAGFCGRFGIPVFLTHGTHIALPDACGRLPEHRLIDSHRPFAINDLHIQPFPVPHDAREPVQFVFSDGDVQLGVLTDCGTVTAHIMAMLKKCDALVLECNHDADLLAASRYPFVLRQRIAGDYGHLGNHQAAELLERIEQGRLRHVVAAHLSEESNRPKLAAAALAEALNCTADWIGVADQESGCDWRQI
ncbi:MBL fold metallo-hydrolase [Dentiradicibacter hellwigii]|uniref:MBL fold metallo-hydrolase n=1 Tax=Dentiradicibacter hellwigii TaxID=3149053 RepID=A0ABV4UE68_9RHOO